MIGIPDNLRTIFIIKKNVFGAMHFIYCLNRLVAMKTDSTYLCD